jgi:hypothetical protein
MMIRNRSSHIPIRMEIEAIDVPKMVRAAELEASVRAAEDWHADAVRAAFASSDDDWKLTAVFCTGYVPGFDGQILESLKSKNPDVCYEAVVAAGNYGRDNSFGNQGYGTITSPGNSPYVITVGASNENGSIIRYDDSMASFSAFGVTQDGYINTPPTNRTSGKQSATSLECRNSRAIPVSRNATRARRTGRP